jgi:hypothetical protein
LFVQSSRDSGVWFVKRIAPAVDRLQAQPDDFSSIRDEHGTDFRAAHLDCSLRLLAEIHRFETTTPG